MKILVACEFSQIVTEAFIKRGHSAMSCDLLPTERNYPHYQGDILDILSNHWDEYDLLGVVVEQSSSFPQVFPKK